MPYAGCDPGLAGLVGAIAWKHAQNPTRRGCRHGPHYPSHASASPKSGRPDLGCAE